MKPGPMLDLLHDYSERSRQLGRSVGIKGLDLREFPESRKSAVSARKREEAAALTAAIAPQSCVIALDECGKTMTSRAFAETVSRYRDDGTNELAFMIGGPDGLDESVLKNSHHVLSFGKMTWPHQLARAMLSEQLYRAVTILAKHPYHRD